MSKLFIIDINLPNKSDSTLSSVIIIAINIIRLYPVVGAFEAGANLVET